MIIEAKATLYESNMCEIKTTHDFFQRLIKQSQSFEISHATAKPLSIPSKRHQARHAEAYAAVYTSSFLYHFFA
jgi:hypothetical protein